MKEVHTQRGRNAEAFLVLIRATRLEVRGYYGERCLVYFKERVAE